MRTLLVGELNPTGADPRFALHPLPANRSGGRLASILPNPSGLCRVWNDPGAAQRAREAVFS